MPAARRSELCRGRPDTGVAPDLRCAGAHPVPTGAVAFERRRTTMKKRTWILGERKPLRFLGAGLLALSS
jgi:hypothetical protein